MFAALGIGFSVARIVREYSPVSSVIATSEEVDFSRTGMFDFHNGGYFPALAFRDGVNPYAPEMVQHYPGARTIPTYSPVVFLIHLPFAYLTVPVADVVYFVVSVLLLALLAYWSIMMSGVRPTIGGWLGIIGLFAFSRAGHVTLFTGYFTIQLVIGTMLALHYGKTKPWLAGCGMLLASGKPTYIIPLTILMLARKNFRSVIIGLTLSAVVGAAGIGWLASFSSVSEVIEGIVRGEQIGREAIDKLPENTWTRLDLFGVVAKIMHWNPGNRDYLVAMLVLLIPSCISIWRASDRESNSGGTGLTALIACLSILLSIYHHTYDCLLVAVPWIGMMFFGNQVCPEIPASRRRQIAILLTIPAVNYISTYKIRGWLELDNRAIAWDLVTSINGVSLLLALMLTLAAAWELGSRAIPKSDSQAKRPESS